MDPAYPIPLTTEQLALLGELTAIIGQIDNDMVLTMTGLLRLNRPTTNKIMGSTKTQVNSDIWASVIKSRSKDAELHHLVDHACKEIAALAGERNKFVHADFRSASRLTHDGRQGWVTVRGAGAKGETTVAAHIKKGTMVDIAELEAVRDRAARLSCLIAHIEHTLAPHGQGRPGWSPWLEKLAPTLPPRPETKEPPKAKGQRPPPQSSRG